MPKSVSAPALPRPTRDPWVWLLCGLALLLLLWTLGRIDGYLLADSVEYMDRAQAVAQGAQLDPSTMRSFAFSALLVPLFWVIDLVGAPSVWAVGLARLLVIAMGLVAIIVVYRAGRARFGVRAGVIAGFVLAVNPVFLQYGVEPLSESAAMMGIALALSAALGLDLSKPKTQAGAAQAADDDQAAAAHQAAVESANGRRALRVGAWLGFAMLMGFKTIPIAGVVLLGLVLMARWRQRAIWWLATSVFVFIALCQCLLDWAVYGRFGGSLGAYLMENVGGLLAGILVKLHGLGVPYAYDLAVRIYENLSAGEGGTVASNASNVTSMIRSTTSEMWYLENMSAAFLMVPFMLGVVVALLVAFKKKRTTTWLLIAVVGLNLVLLSTKSSKSFRLLIPLLPAVALLAGNGLDYLLTGLRERMGLIGRAVGIVLGFWLVWAGLADGQATLARTNLTQYGSWWQASADLQRLADAAHRDQAEDAEPWTFASAYHWAVRFRAQGKLSLIKLPHHMDRWDELETNEREETLTALGELDAFLAHLQILTQDPRILSVVNERFQILDIRYDAATFDDLGPLYVLVRRDLEVPHATRKTPRTFFELHKDADPGAHQAALTNAHSVDFRRRQPEGPTWQMVLLGYELETGLADDQLSWLTLHWFIGDTGGHDFTIVTRITDRDDRALDGNHKPANGVWTTDKLQAGWILEESMPIPMPLDPKVFGGADARGDAVPVRFWVAIAEFDEGTEDAPLATPVVVSGLNPFQPTGERPIQRRSEGKSGVSIDGYRWSPDGLFQVGGFWLPVPAAAKLK